MKGFYKKYYMDYNRKFHVSTQLASLFGEKYADHILVGKKYWWFFDDTSEVYRKTNTHWNKLEITYIRSGIVFYTVENIEEEYHFQIGSIMSEGLEPEFLDPIKELGETVDNLDNLYFNSERTQVINFENTECYG